MDNTTYGMEVTVNFPNGIEREFTCANTRMPQGALEDAIIAAIDGNQDATSFVFVVIRRRD